MSIEVNKTAGIATITLNRPSVHNAFDDEMIVTLTNTLHDLECDPDIRVILLRGAGKHFSAGADLQWMQRIAHYTYEENVQDARQLATLMSTLYHLHKPTLAAIHGAAFGGAVGLIACCDMAVAIDTVEFCLSETRLGLIPAVISPYVINAIGERAARRYYLTAERFNASEAYRLGLVHITCPAATFEETIDHLVQSIKQNSPAALVAAKQLIAATSRSEINAPLIEDTAHRIAVIRTSAEGQEGLQAFLQKRKPNWSL
jgi:methylglutaconyl-CoA hydratase